MYNFPALPFKENKKMKYKVIKEHNILKDRFPLGYEGNFYNHCREEDHIIPAHWWGKDMDKWSEEIILPKGEFLDIVFIDKNGAGVTSTMIYLWTGKPVTDFFQNLSKPQE